MFSCNQLEKSDAKTSDHKFYDFNFSIVSYEQPVGKTKEISYDYKYDSIDVINNKLEIKYKEFIYDDFYVYEKTIEKSYFIDKEKMDTIFHLISSKVSSPYLYNASSVIKPVPYLGDNEWEHCQVTLDFALRGDIYSNTSIDTKILNDILEIISIKE